ncbi:MAG: peptide deformylase 2 [Candidatus Hepatoplasma scabrum]|nr:MAG: peptide deformylase 2 [Candidatus Hepatoplasma sp.]
MAQQNKVKIKQEDRISIKNIIDDSNPKLREISFDVPYPLSKEDKLIMHQMIDYVRSSVDPNRDQNDKRELRPAYGISAIQLGYPKKMLFIHVPNEFGKEPEEFALVNPKVIQYTDKKAYLAGGEGCLSVNASHPGYVLRSYGIKIVAIDYFTDREVEIDAKGLTAVVLQHEIDHLLGILFYDRINKLQPFILIDKKAIKL